MLYFVYNMVASVLSYPLGKLSDKIGRKYTLCIGYFLYAVVYLCIGFSSSNAAFWGLFAIKETGRLTDKRIELGESAIAELDVKLQLLVDMIAEHPEISVTYFQPDEKKAGGAYVTDAGAVKKIDDVERTIIFKDGKIIPISDVLEIECELYRLREYRWQLDNLPDKIRDLVMDDERLRNELCWYVFN